MKLLVFTTLYSLTALVGFAPFAAHGQTRTYVDTRKLLLKVERSPANKALKKLFEERDTKRADLIQALHDPEQKVNLNSQVILKYLADPQALAALEEWYGLQRKLGKDYSMPKMEVLSEVKYLEGIYRDLGELVLKNLHPESKDVSVAYNKRMRTALIEVIIGEVFTEGWHVVVRRENRKWRLISNRLVWQS